MSEQPVETTQETVVVDSTTESPPQTAPQTDFSIHGNWLYSDHTQGLEGVFQFQKDNLYKSSNLDVIPTVTAPFGIWSTGLYGYWKKVSPNLYNVRQVEAVIFKDPASPCCGGTEPFVGYATGTAQLSDENTALFSVNVNVYPAGTYDFSGPPLFGFPIAITLHRVEPL